MQDLDYRKFTNSGNWAIILNKDTLLFEIVSLGNNKRLNKTFTNRKFAEQHLYHYLDKVENPNPRGRPKGSTSKPKLPSITEDSTK